MPIFGVEFHAKDFRLASTHIARYDLLLSMVAGGGGGGLRSAVYRIEYFNIATRASQGGYLDQGQRKLVSQHVDELQSIRGLAAAVVAISHASSFYETPSRFRLLVDATFNAHASVVIFFVLSGYVLAGSLTRRGGGRDAIAAFYARRIFRLFPALWCVSLLSYILLSIVKIPFWFNFESLSSWGRPHIHPVPDLTRSLLALVALDGSLIMPVWTVFEELVGSAAMPLFVMFFLSNRRFWLPIVFTIMLLALSVSGLPHRLNYLADLQYFALGTAAYVCNPFRQTRGRPWWTISAVFILIFFRLAWHWIETGNPQALTYRYSDPIVGAVEGIAAAVLVAVFGAGKKTSQFLGSRPIVKLGDISYSLYLLHMPVAIALVVLLSRLFPGLSGVSAAFTLIGLTLAISFPLSAVCFHLIELPFIRLGSRFGGRPTARVAGPSRADGDTSAAP